MRNTNKAVCESAREKPMISSIYSRAAIVPHCLKLGTTAVRLPNNPLIKEGPPCLSVDFRAVPVNYRTHNIWNLFQIFLKHAYYYHSYSCGRIPSFGYCINIVLTCTLHRFNVKYYNLQCWCKQSLWLSFTLCDLVSLLLYFPLDVGLAVFQFNSLIRGLWTLSRVEQQQWNHHSNCFKDPRNSPLMPTKTSLPIICQ